MFGERDIRAPLLKRLMACTRGNAMLMTVAAMPIIIGAAGLATDTAQWALWKRQLQRQADSAALAGAYAKAQGASAISSATNDLNRTSEVPLSAPATIENAPTTGAYAGNAKAVRVALQASRTLPFSSLYMSQPPVVYVEATAAVVSEGQYCVIALENTSTVGITMQGNATVSMGCGMATNSKASNAVVAGGSSSIVATPVAAVGGLQASSNYASPTTLEPYSAPQEDPFENLPEPVLPNCSNKLSVNPNASVTVTPTGGVACYRGMDIKGTVTLQPGVYYIDGDAFSVGSQGVVTGDGVTIILTSKTATSNPSSIATININGGAEVRLTAPTSGTYKGIIFYQDRRALDSQANKINGNANSKYEGAIYMPRQQIEFTGTSDMDTECVQIVGRRVVFSGDSNFENHCTSGYGAFTGTRVRLVG